ncbi:hypothetical protein POJ06DRAFT_251614 [Lipomyces tetrasporus]|uniref:Uncharacterized protein n=1 Tax=Lipomyces tetrasporus TaxID=54092 RepID=A0AAD7QUX7_9ASCO|nr:uncharacterized protein POJ06DRAFT_251614 [Lipomyces tetrasporus]KAJ8101466.1 hypothetical protein POJ06DRAFT_251614 [Lipomyces tetrasporus]
MAIFRTIQVLPAEILVRDHVTGLLCRRSFSSRSQEQLHLRSIGSALRYTSPRCLYKVADKLLIGTALRYDILRRYASPPRWFTSSLPVFRERQGESSMHQFTPDEFRDAILQSNAMKREHGAKLRRRLFLGTMSTALLLYGLYKLYVLDESFFVPYWIKPYIFEEILTRRQLDSLKQMTGDALIEALAYQELVAANIGLPIIIESLDEVKFAFPSDRPAEHVLKGIEVYRKTDTQHFPSIRRSVRIFSIREIRSKFITPLADAIGMTTDEAEEPVHEIMENMELNSNIWVEVTGKAAISGAKARREHNDNKAKPQLSSPARKCVVQFKGYLDLERMNTVRIQSGDLIFFENGEEVRRISW